MSIDAADWDRSVAPGTLSHASNGRTTIDVAHIPQFIKANTSAKVVMVRAIDTNSGTIYIGGISVSDNPASSNAGFPLAPGEAFTLSAVWLQAIWFVGAAGDGVFYAYWY